MLTRDRIHHLIDEPPEHELPDALRAIERFLAGRGGDPLLAALANAPEDDEPVTPDEEGIQEGMAATARGDMVSQVELRRALGGCDPRPASIGAKRLRDAAPIRPGPRTPR